ncbi:MAG: hypothetical protein JNL21_25200 [Myxococcales bacterium]|nr:hypothetical protein [Myxococcales bacterium]
MTKKSFIGLVCLVGLGCGDDAGSGGSGAGGVGGAGGVVGPPEVAACDGATLFESPADTSEPGPWPVGVRSGVVDGLAVEIWYPAKRGSEIDAAKKKYDMRDWLPEAERAKIPDEAAPLQTCDCSADLPLDGEHGPYPVIFFVHGTAGFRAQSLELTRHWASRGFVVVAADHPGLYLNDILAPLCGGMAPARDLTGDIAKLTAAVQAPAGDLSFLAGRIDATRIGMSGHSAGGGAIEDQGNVARVLVPMAAGGTVAGTALESTLVLASQEDKVVDYMATLSSFEASPTPRRLVGLSPAGHLAFSSLCAIQNAAGEDVVTIGDKYMVCGLQFAEALFDCDATYLPDETGWAITNEASTAAFEEVLHCRPERAAVFGALKAKYPGVAEVIEAP